MKTLALAFAKGKIAPVGRQFKSHRPFVIAFIGKQESKKLNQDNQNKKKGGRPKKSSTVRKSKTIGVCFSEPELYAIKHRAKQANLPVSIYCHDAILNGTIKEPIKKEDMEVLKGLANMGNNLNQFVKTARFTNMIKLENAALVLLKEMQNIIENLSDDWKNSKRKKL
ncbi:MAG: plasmid mobilization protein [Dysgonomonas sp.]